MRQLVRALDLANGADSIQLVAAAIGSARGRPVVLRAAAFGGHGVSGAWLLMADEDVIVFEAETSQRHQAQIIAHELGHMVCGHAGTPMPSAVGGVRLAAGAAGHMLTRHGYDASDERDAELVADLLLAHLDAASRVVPADPVAAALLKP